MSKSITICCVAVVVVVSLLPLVNCSKVVVNKDNPRFQRVQRMFREISANRTIPTEKIFWNPWLIIDGKLKTNQISQLFSSFY